MMVAGFGCRKGASLDDLTEAFLLAVAHCGVDRAEIEALATPAEKQGEPALKALAAELLLPLIPVEADILPEASARTLSHSDRVVALKGVPSVAETAALAAAGPNSRLLAPKVSSRSATCAIAIGGAS
ncbi:cobalamin biosynthesis protein [Methyloligella solikamskensis]|uniref:Cobalamin biosynthesis protein n=1 Tax=Methyloligella solikamskensis TaxID=1177756 RepID=A0ABW3J891_9HYPH